MAVPFKNSRYRWSAQHSKPASDDYEVSIVSSLSYQEVNVF